MSTSILNTCRKISFALFVFKLPPLNCKKKLAQQRINICWAPTMCQELFKSNSHMLLDLHFKSASNYTPLAWFDRHQSSCMLACMLADRWEDIFLDCPQMAALAFSPFRPGALPWTIARCSSDSKIPHIVLLTPPLRDNAKKWLAFCEAGCFPVVESTFGNLSSNSSVYGTETINTTFARCVSSVNYTSCYTS